MMNTNNDLKLSSLELCKNSKEEVGPDIDWLQSLKLHFSLSLILGASLVLGTLEQKKIELNRKK